VLGGLGALVFIESGGATIFLSMSMSGGMAMRAGWTMATA